MDLAPVGSAKSPEPVTLWMDEAGHLHLTPTDRRKAYRAIPSDAFDALLARAERAEALLRELRGYGYLPRCLKLSDPCDCLTARIDAAVGEG